MSLFFPQDDATAVAYTQKRMAGDETLEGEVRYFCFLPFFPLYPLLALSAPLLPPLPTPHPRFPVLTYSPTRQSYEFRWVRDYQVASIRPLQQEYIFTFDAGEAGSTPEENAARPATAKGREKGAYYVPISNVTQLRKRRAKVRFRFRLSFFPLSSLLGRIEILCTLYLCGRVDRW